MKKTIFLYLLIFSVWFTFSCEDGFPTELKKNLPEGHNEQKGIAFHKSGLEYPYAYDSSRGESNCAGAKCHHNDLRGGIAESNSIPVVSPSCYQCHGKIWFEIDTAYNKTNY
ncbi:MAG: hypothetical protein HZB41_00020 [Ignavibacteriae bacterium]|nr:hypothetical protein [Ignavibacteriota bacterium]